MPVAVRWQVRLFWLLLLAAGCDGILQEKTGVSDADASVLNTIPPPPCADPATAMGPADCTGGGVPGDDCLMCHHQGSSAPAYTFAGTLYDPTGTMPVAGATVYVQDSVGNTASTVTHANGNFYTVDAFVMYPAKTFVSLCPSVIEMVSPVDQETGANCNTAGCHTPGFRVHLP